MTSTREKILTTADDLFYRQGFEATSFADIAGAVGISRGNFYYHFRSKDEILDGVITLRLGRTEQMLEDWQQSGHSPQERIRSFIGILLRNREPIMAHGCPVGTLCAELAKLSHSAHDQATQLFTLFRAWLTRQFEALGFVLTEADSHAMHVLMCSQGVASLANAFHDTSFITREVAALNEWLDMLAPAGEDQTCSSSS